MQLHFSSLLHFIIRISSRRVLILVIIFFFQVEVKMIEELKGNRNETAAYQKLL